MFWRERKAWTYERANPLVWGAVTGLTAAAIIALSDYFGTPRPDNTLLAYPFKAGLAFYGFGVMVAMFRNWFNERRP